MRWDYGFRVMIDEFDEHGQQNDVDIAEQDQDLQEYIQYQNRQEDIRSHDRKQVLQENFDEQKKDQKILNFRRGNQLSMEKYGIL